MLLGLWKSNILPNFETVAVESVTAVGSPGLFLLIVRVREMLFASSLKRFCDLPGGSSSMIRVPAVVRVGQMNLPSSLVCRKHFLCEQNMGPQGCI